MSAAKSDGNDSTSAQTWLVKNLSADDAKVLSALFSAQSISAVADLLLLSKDDLVELKVAIGVRNRFLEAQAKAKGGSGGSNGGVPVAPNPPPPVFKQPTHWKCPACTAENIVARTRCELCGTQSPYAPLFPTPVGRGGSGVIDAGGAGGGGMVSPLSEPPQSFPQNAAEVPLMMSEMPATPFTPHSEVFYPPHSHPHHPPVARKKAATPPLSTAEKVTVITATAATSSAAPPPQPNPAILLHSERPVLAAGVAPAVLVPQPHHHGGGGGGGAPPVKSLMG